jgi:zinc protease
MRTYKIFVCLIAGLIFTQYAQSQTDLTQPVPVDPEIRTGKLDNGMTYFIRHNAEPQKRASFYIIQNVGALLEDDKQNGLAHFLEHMAFNGTEHFPGKGIISTLEKHGVAFGNNINAYTSFNETVYNLSNIPVDPDGLMDTCLLVLNDWSHYLLLTNDEIDAERGVITEEWRTRRDANFRMMKQIFPVLFKDSKYEVRDVFGDLDVIKNFDYTTLRNFYHDWYRTDLQAIAIVGDFDVNEMENKIKSLFSKIEPVKNPLPRPFFDIPYHKEPLFGLALDKEAPQTSVDIYIIKPSTDESMKNKSYLRERFIDDLMNSMMATRISELLQKANPPFVSGSVNFSGLERGYDALNINATARQNQEDVALESILTEAERAKRFGFQKSELERAKAEMLANYETYYKQKDKITNDDYISNIQQYFLDKEPLASIDFEFEFLKSILPGISAEEISARFKELIPDDNWVILVQGPEGEGIKHLFESDALGIIKKVKESSITQNEEVSLSQSLINNDLKGSKIIKTVSLKQFDAVEWTLENRAKVVYRKANFEKDNVILRAYSKGGMSLYNVDLLPSATMLPLIISTYGAGDYDNITLQKMLAGKTATVGATLGEITEGFNGSSTPKDFEIMMQLLYLKFENPRFDKVAHDAIMSRYAAYLANLEKDPGKIMQDSVSLIITDHNPRTMLLNTGFLEKVNFEKIEKIYTERFSNAGDFTFFIVGNISEDSVKPIVEKYIGSLNSHLGTEKWIDRKVRAPKGKLFRDIQIPMTVPKGTVYVTYSEKARFNPYNNLGLNVIKNILDLVYTEKVREEEGGTYGVSINVSSAKYPYQNASAMIMFDCDPARTGELKTIIYNEIDNMIKVGPDKENLDKAIINMLKNREENRMHNSYWSSTLYSYYFNGIDNNDPSNFENILKSYTVKDIQKIAKTFFDKADVTDIVFTPETK